MGRIKCMLTSVARCCGINLEIKLPASMRPLLDLWRYFIASNLKSTTSGREVEKYLYDLDNILLYDL